MTRAEERRERYNNNIGEKEERTMKTEYMIINIDEKYVDIIFRDNGRYYTIYDLNWNEKDLSKAGRFNKEFVEQAYEKAINK